MPDKSNELEVLRGEIIEVTINGETVKVSRLSIDEQLDVIDLFSKNSADVSSKGMIQRMVSVISIAVHKELEINSFKTAGEIVEAFGLIWRQNEFDFLLKQVASLNLSNQK